MMDPRDPLISDEAEYRAHAARDAAKRVTDSEPSDLDKYYRRHDRWVWRKRFWLIGAGVVVFLAGVLLIGALMGDERTPRGAEALLALADKPLADPEAPVTTLHAEQTLRQYYLGAGVEGRVAAELQRRTWYEAPNRQRIEEESTTYHLDGSVASRSSHVYVWDGASVWRYDVSAATLHVAAQDPDLDPWLSSLGGGLYLGRRGADPAQPTPRECSNPAADRPGRVADRLAHVFESNPLGCGLVLPGTDGRATTWVDDATALLLRLERHDIHGTVGVAIDTTVFEVNGHLDAMQFAFVASAGVSINDARPARFVDGVGTPQRIVPSIAEAQAAAGVPIRTMVVIPPGFTFAVAAVSLDGPGQPGPGATVQFTYAGPASEWIAVAQGVSLYYYLGVQAPDAIPSGTTTVRGIEAHWVQGRPVAGDLWEPGTMTVLAWEDPSGNGVPQQYAVASNTLTVEQLRAIAESLR